MAPNSRPGGRRIAVLGSPRGLTNGGERPALRRARRVGTPTLDFDFTLLGPIAAGVAGGLALFIAFGAYARDSLGPLAQTGLVAVAAAAAIGALWLAWRTRE